MSFGDGFSKGSRAATAVCMRRVTVMPGLFPPLKEILIDNTYRKHKQKTMEKEKKRLL